MTEQKELYLKLKKRESVYENLLATVIDGPQIGNKAFISNGKVLAGFGDTSIFEDNMETIQNPVKNEAKVNDNRIFVENIGNQKKIVICGGGHVANQIIRLATMVGFHTTVIEDRPMFADQARAAGASCVICDDFMKALDTISGDPDTYFIVVTRGHRHDKDCLLRIFNKPHAYIGMMGSKGRVKNMKKTFLEEGTVSQELLDEWHSPIGLDIKAETPAEIAISVIAEIIECKNSLVRYNGYNDELVAGLSGCDEYPGKQVLGTIITRKGSAPRAKGTKMIIRDNGSIVATIGGGCMEAEVIRKAQFMMATYDPDTYKPQTVFVDMTGRYAEDEGMACGGVIEVFLEML